MRRPLSRPNSLREIFGKGAGHNLNFVRNERGQITVKSEIVLPANLRGKVKGKLKRELVLGNVSGKTTVVHRPTFSIRLTRFGRNAKVVVEGRVHATHEGGITPRKTFRHVLTVPKEHIIKD